MLWKILSGVSAVALAVGVWFSYQSKLAYVEERKLGDNAKSYLKATQQEYTKATELKERKVTELAELEKQRDAVKGEVAKANTEIEEKVKEVEAINNNLTEIKKQVAQLEAEIGKAGDIQKLMVVLKDLNQQKVNAESAIANGQQQIAMVEEQLTGVQGRIGQLQEVESRQKSGIVEPGFSARVSQAFPGFGFVILNKGNTGGVFANAMLDVKRGRNVVAKLKVRDVEQSLSVADLVPGTMAPGNALRTGDLVVPSKDRPAAAASAPAPAPLTPPADGGTPAAMPGGGPAGADPFGAPSAAPGGMASPAPADPFGAPAPAPAPAAPAAPANADPFAPAAPAMDGSAPAMGGTPAAPSTADPFAPKP